MQKHTTDDAYFIILLHELMHIIKFMVNVINFKGISNTVTENLLLSLMIIVQNYISNFIAYVHTRVHF